MDLRVGVVESWNVLALAASGRVGVQTKPSLVNIGRPGQQHDRVPIFFKLPPLRSLWVKACAAPSGPHQAKRFRTEACFFIVLPKHHRCTRPFALAVVQNDRSKAHNLQKHCAVSVDVPNFSIREKNSKGIQALRNWKVDFAIHISFGRVGPFGIMLGTAGINGSSKSSSSSGSSMPAER